MFLALVVIALVASFCIVSVLFMVVMEKRREVAIFKAMGAEDGAVRRIFALEGLYIGVLGVGTGVPLGVTVSALMAKYGLPIPTEIYYVNRLPVVLRLSDVSGIFLVALALCALAVSIRLGAPLGWKSSTDCVASSRQMLGLTPRQHPATLPHPYAACAHGWVSRKPSDRRQLFRWRSRRVSRTEGRGVRGGGVKMDGTGGAALPGSRDRQNLRTRRPAPRDS